MAMYRQHGICVCVLAAFWVTDQCQLGCRVKQGMSLVDVLTLFGR